MNPPQPLSRAWAIWFCCQRLNVDPSAQVRSRAAHTLGLIGRHSDVAKKALFQAAEHDANATVRTSALEAIAQLYSDPDPRPDSLTQLIQLLQTMADQPKVQQTFNAPVTGVAGNVEGDFIINAQQEQDLAVAASKIQALLTQLAQTYPNESDRQLEAVKREVKRNVTFKARLLNATKAGGVEAVKQVLDYVFKHPVATVVAEAVKAFVETES